MRERGHHPLASAWPDVINQLGGLIVARLWARLQNDYHRPSMAHTRTGSFPIAFRRLRSEWQHDLDRLIDFARESDFLLLDVGPVGTADLQRIRDAGLAIGSVDLLRWSELASPDPAKRADAVNANVQHISGAAALGVKTFMAVMLPEDTARPRAENFEFAVDGWGKMSRAIEPLGVRIALEGWPGPPPHFAAFACTPADCRAVFDAIGSDVMGINYDPSHLVRMGIDPLRFLGEFGSRVFHFHAKDTAILEEGRYEHGTLQTATFVQPPRWSGHSWRYVLPGRGVVPWSGLFQQLVESGYRGAISIELEDLDYFGSESGERRGLIEARDFLANV